MKSQNSYSYVEVRKRISLTKSYNKVCVCVCFGFGSRSDIISSVVGRLFPLLWCHVSTIGSTSANIFDLNRKLLSQHLRVTQFQQHDRGRNEITYISLRQQGSARGNGSQPPPQSMSIGNLFCKQFDRQTSSCYHSTLMQFRVPTFCFL